MEHSYFCALINNITFIGEKTEVEKAKNFDPGLTPEKSESGFQAGFQSWAINQ